MRISKISNIIESFDIAMHGESKSFSQERLDICAECAISVKSIIGLFCSDAKFLDVESNTSHSTYRDGYKKGCGCFLISKAANKYNRCPAGKW